MRAVAFVTCVLLAACGSLEGDALSAGNGTQTPVASSSSAAPTPVCGDPVKCSTPPPGWTPYVAPPCDLPLTTPDEVRIAAAQMSVAPGDPPVRDISEFGAPLFVHAFALGNADEWVVPRSDGRGGASTVVAVTIRADGRGCAGIAAGWSGPFPRISIDDARKRAAAPNDPVVAVEAVYMPFEKVFAPSQETDPVWRIVRASGHELFLFDSGMFVEGEFVREALGVVGLRGAPADATPAPLATPRALYRTRDADAVLAGARADPLVIRYLRYLRGESGEPHAPVTDPRLDTPMRIVGYHKPYTVDAWILPVRDASNAVVSLVAVVGGNLDMGSAVEVRGWSGPFPRVSEADAKRIATDGNDPIISLQLGWAEEYYVSPGGITAPFWIATRRSGAQSVITEDGKLTRPAF